MRAESCGKQGTVKRSSSASLESMFHIYALPRRETRLYGRQHLCRYRPRYRSPFLRPQFRLDWLGPVKRASLHPCRLLPISDVTAPRETVGKTRFLRVATIHSVAESGGLSDERCFPAVGRPANQCCRPVNDDKMTN